MWLKFFFFSTAGRFHDPQSALHYSDVEVLMPGESHDDEHMPGASHAHDALVRNPRIWEKIRQLQAQARQQKEERTSVQKELKNARMRRSRLVKKTKGLSSADLMELMAERGARAASSCVSLSPAAGDGVSGATGSGSGSGNA